jgi:hypothetical protein
MQYPDSAHNNWYGLLYSSSLVWCLRSRLVLLSKMSLGWKASWAYSRNMWTNVGAMNDFGDRSCWAPITGGLATYITELMGRRYVTLIGRLDAWLENDFVWMKIWKILRFWYVKLHSWKKKRYGHKYSFW